MSDAADDATDDATDDAAGDGSAARRRWALLVEYDGTPFCGWQRQRNGVSVQAVLEAAAARLANGAPVATGCAGRTDSGVHARGQVALLELPPVARDDWTGPRLRAALDFHLRPHPVAVLEAAPAPPGWHPRFSATGRHYRYAILNRPARPTLDAGQSWHVDRPLDLDAMRIAAALLLGRHDFSSFRAAACQADSPVRTLDRLDIRSAEGGRVIVEASARSFLHHQVRNLVGSLVLVGLGRWRPERMGEVLRAADRRLAGPTAPAGGLTLVGVDYPAASDPFR